MPQAAPRRRFKIIRFFWRHKKLSLALLAGAAGADVMQGHHIVTRLEGPLPTINKTIPCATEICDRTTRDVQLATALWLESKKARSINVPSYINLAYNIGAVGIESMGGAKIHTRGSSYLGIMQFSRLKEDSHFFVILPQLIETLKEVQKRNPAAIPMLSGKPITRQTLTQRDVFKDNIIQVFAGMELALHAAKTLESTPAFLAFPEFYKHAALYLFHNNPRATRAITRNTACQRPIIQLSPKDRGNFSANGSIYDREGREIPARVLYRVMNIKYPYLQRAAIVLGDEDLKAIAAPQAPFLYRSYGVVSHYVIRPWMNRSACTQG